MVNQASMAPREDSLQFDAAQAGVPVLQLEDLLVAEFAAAHALLFILSFEGPAHGQPNLDCSARRQPAI